MTKHEQEVITDLRQFFTDYGLVLDKWEPEAGLPPQYLIRSRNGDVALDLDLIMDELNGEK